nr:hypothetical protein Iba_scaffold1393CG0190 [Ipomoea batatas]
MDGKKYLTLSIINLRPADERRMLVDRLHISHKKLRVAQMEGDQDESDNNEDEEELQQSMDLSFSTLASKVDHDFSTLNRRVGHGFQWLANIESKIGIEDEVTRYTNDKGNRGTQKSSNWSMEFVARTVEPTVQVTSSTNPLPNPLGSNRLPHGSMESDEEQRVPQDLLRVPLLQWVQGTC